MQHPEDPRIADFAAQDSAPPSDDLYDCEGCDLRVESVANVRTQDGLGQFLCAYCEEAHEMNYTDELGPEMMWMGPIDRCPGVKP